MTSSGRLYKGGEVFSLRRSFEEAGARAVLSTMWEAPDRATQKFMSKFYQYYFDKVPPQLALRAVQLTFLQHITLCPLKMFLLHIQMAKNNKNNIAITNCHPSKHLLHR